MDNLELIINEYQNDYNYYIYAFNAFNNKYIDSPDIVKLITAYKEYFILYVENIVQKRINMQPLAKIFKNIYAVFIELFKYIDIYILLNDTSKLERFNQYAFM